MAGMMFMVTIPTECMENKLNAKSHVVPEIIVTNENQQVPRSDRNCTAGASRSLQNVREKNLFSVMMIDQILIIFRTE